MKKQWGDEVAYLKLMMDAQEIAHLDLSGEFLCACENVPQHKLPLNLFVGDSRCVPLVEVVVWAKKRVFPKERTDCDRLLKTMGLAEYDAWEIVRKTGACLMEDPYWLKFSDTDSFADTTRGRAKAAGFAV